MVPPRVAVLQNISCPRIGSLVPAPVCRQPSAGAHRFEETSKCAFALFRANDFSPAPSFGISGTGKRNYVPDAGLRKKLRHERGGILANGRQKNFRSGAAAGRRNGRTGDGDTLQENGAKYRGMARFWPELRKPQRDRMCNCIPATRGGLTITPGQGVAPTPHEIIGLCRGLFIPVSGIPLKTPVSDFEAFFWFWGIWMPHESLKTALRRFQDE